ncbi:diguanylate cyclase [Shewanella maritima]|uniref:diguanylate cyclase n=2 Tax=Shewanella maritima TaxID=2520507 RepID=A0A411PH53_9GAMM|nr:diguanylate cyclase [Shewanella maritima]
MLAVIFFMAWHSMGKQRFALFFFASFAISAVMWAINLAKPIFGQVSFYWSLVTSLSMIAVLLGTWGHKLRANTRLSPYVFIGLFIIGFSGTFYFSAIDRHAGLMMSWYLYVDVISLLLSSWIIYRHRVKPRPAEIGAAVIHLIFAICLAVAASIALAQGRQFDPELIALYSIVNFTALPAAYVGMSVFVLYMLASDLAEDMKSLAMTDPLTLCLNRRGFFEQAQQQIYQYHQRNQHVCLIYWDIDKFKSINDNYGHSAGDTVLITTTRRVQRHIKRHDLIGRLGGEEFVILIARAEYRDAVNVAERLRVLLAKRPVKSGKVKIPVTASFGVVDIPPSSPELENAINLADKAVYLAKEQGRNQVVFSQA